MKISVNFIESVARHQYLWYNTGMDIFVLTEPGVMDATWAGQYADGIRTQALTLKYRVLELRWPNVAASAGHTVIVNGFSRRFYRAADPAVRAAGGVPLWLAPADVCVHPDFTGATAGLLKQLKNAGCERIAFFGANPDSLNDGPKLTVYRGSGGRDVFYNRGDLRDCFRAFASRGGGSLTAYFFPTG